jgi:FAD/FMN-containing dehydrogenase
MLLNDVHSQLNPTRVAQVERPTTLSDLREVVRQAKRRGMSLSIGGARHAMGGQQFATDQLHVDTRGLNRVLQTDVQRGLLQIEAGADWPRIISAAHEMVAPDGHRWAIRQKQTGVDEVTLGGSISANAHGRGLLMQPLGADIEDLTLVDAHGDLVVCSRSQNAELFSLVIGGYGLFGLIYAATLRLAPRRRVRRVVDILDLADAMNAVYRRVREGCLYGDFQFVIDPNDASFLHRGVFACYEPIASPDLDPVGADSADLQPEAWLQLLRLAHEDKAQAFRLYSQHYLSTHGSTYWSDTMQLGTYIPSYAEFLESLRAADAPPGPKETLVIGEHYVPRDQIATFMAEAAQILKSRGVEVIYGTIRAILRDESSFLTWAKADYACVIFNLRTPHTLEGKARTADAFRSLIDAALNRGGSYFLTYHRYATREQVLRAYPQFKLFLERKRHFDPECRFTSDWYRHHVALMDESAPSEA